MRYLSNNALSVRAGVRGTLLIIALLLFSLLLSFPGEVAQAGSVEIEERVVVGRGKSREEAVMDGLIEALRQVQGLEIEEMQTTRREFEDVFELVEGEEQVEMLNSEEIQQEVTSKSEGVIDGYEVKNWHEGSDGSWEVMLNVRVPRYQSRTGEQENQATLAVMTFETSQAGQTGSSLNLEEIARQLTHEISSRAVQSDFFRVLDRDYTEEWQQERDLILEGDVASSEKARLGEKLGADFLLTGRLAEVYSETEQVDYYGMQLTRYRVNLTVEIRAVEFATREIAWSDTVTAEHSGLLRKTGVRESEILESLVPELIDDLSARLNQGLNDVLMPLYIVDVRDDLIYLNQGQNRLAEGEKLRVMGPPEEIEDPYTDRTRTITGTERASLRVRELHDDYSLAEISEGDTADLRAGLMIERAAKVEDPDDTSILISSFEKSREAENNYQKIDSTPFWERMHLKLLDDPEIAGEIEVLSTKGVDSDRALSDEIDIPSYIITGEIQEFEVSILDELSGLFVDKYALEFTMRISWEIVDGAGKTVIREQADIVYDFEAESFGEGDPDPYEMTDRDEIIELLETALDEIITDVSELVFANR